MTNPLRVGIIGLGSRWQRCYKPALLALRSRYRIQAVYDQRHRRAQVEAKRLRCDAAAGPTQMLERHDLDALLLLDRQWFRLWPLELACRAGKPVFCGGALESDDAHADALQQRIVDSRLPVMMALLPRFAPATARVRQLLESRLGTPRLLLCEYRVPQAAPSQEAQPRTDGQETSELTSFFGNAGVVLLDWCTRLLDGGPVSVLASGGDREALATMLLQFPGGAAVQITRHRAPGTARVLQLRVIAEHGMVEVQLPGRIAWSGPEGEYALRLPRSRPASQVLLDHFHDALRAGQAPTPSLAHAHCLLGWLRAASRSRAEGRRVELT